MNYYMRRMLLTAAPTDGGAGGGGTPPVTPPVSPPVAPPPVTPPQPPASGGDPNVVSIPLAKYEELIGLQTKAQAAADAANNARLLAIADKQGVDKMLDESNKSWQQKYDGLLAKQKANAVNLALTTATAGVTFLSPAAQSQAMALLKSNFKVVELPDGSESIVDGQGRPATVAVAEMLKSSDYAHFLKPVTTGGSGAGGGDRPSPTGGGEQKPLTEAEKYLAEYDANVRKAIEAGHYTPSVMNSYARMNQIANKN